MNHEQTLMDTWSVPFPAVNHSRWTELGTRLNGWATSSKKQALHSKKRYSPLYCLSSSQTDLCISSFHCNSQSQLSENREDDPSSLSAPYCQCIYDATSFENRLMRLDMFITLTVGKVSTLRKYEGMLRFTAKISHGGPLKTCFCRAHLSVDAMPRHACLCELSKAYAYIITQSQRVHMAACPTHGPFFAR